jgi:beta-glucosidase-like glycosyl hydrolase
MYCDADAPLAARLSDLVARLAPEDLQGLLSNGNAGLPAFGVPRMGFGEALHGALTLCGAAVDNSSTGCATSFPNPLAMARSLNRSLWSAVGAAIGTESRALHNEGLAGGVVWAPNVNLFRDVRWGRGIETAGEDPLVASEYSAAFIASLQLGSDAGAGSASSSSLSTPPYLLVPAQAKHALAYDCESCDGIGRNSFDALVSDHDLVEYFFPPFRAAIQRGRVSGLMCSYNALNGVPSCANGLFLNDVARNAWGAGGDALAVVSDCGAIREIWKDYFYTRDNESAVAAALHGGCDFECGGTFDSYVVKALDRGDIVLADLQQAARRMLLPWFRMGLLDPPERQPFLSLSARDVDTPASRALAYEAALQSIVLLANRVPANASAPLLPLRAGAALRRLALIGPNAQVTTGMLGSYHGQNLLVAQQSVLAALQRRGARDGFSVALSVGCANVSCTDSSGFAAAAATAAAADIAIVVLGLCADECPGGDADGGVGEGEGRDRPNTDLPGLQAQLLRDVAASGTPTVLLLLHGGPLSIDWAAENCDAIVSLVYPGQAGGDAAAAVLFGDYSPAGRTTTTWYSSAWQRMRPFIISMELAPHAGVLGHVSGITYLYNNNASEILFPFGFGLSYGNFSFEWQDAAAPGAVAPRTTLGTHQLAEGPPPSFAVNVTNIGTVVSDVTAMAFISGSGAPSEPLRECFDFARAAAVAPGSWVLLTFTLPPWVAARVDAAGVQAVSRGAFVVSVVGGSGGAAPVLERALELEGEDVVIFDMAAVRTRARERGG